MSGARLGPMNELMEALAFRIYLDPVLWILAIVTPFAYWIVKRIPLWTYRVEPYPLPRWRAKE